MNREIKFRAWDTENERMAVPYLFEESGHSDTGYRYYEDWRDCEDGRSYPCHVMQFTGLKDANSVEIFEGDIVRCDAAYTETRTNFCGKVTWQDFRGCWAVGSDYWNNDLWRYVQNGGACEVLGNIYEHPHLLEQSSPSETQ